MTLEGDKDLEQGSNDAGEKNSAKIDEELLHILKAGCEMLKFKRNGKKYKRNFYLDPDHQTLKYTGSRKLCRSQKSVEIPDIKEIRMGASTQTFKNVAHKIVEGKAFSLIIGPKHESLDLMAKSPEQKDEWVSALRHVMALHKNMEQQKQHERWAIDHFNMADINKDGGLSFDETLVLLNQMNINMDKRYARKLFDASDINTKKNKLNEDVLDQQEFLNFYKLLIRRPEIVDIIRAHSINGNTFLESNELLEFMKTEQKQSDITLEECVKLIKTYEKSNIDGTMTVEGMRCMLVSRDQAIFNKNHLSVYQDMNLPLSLYFINSSHNTYLTTDQLMGPSSIEGYILALLKGCRCIEIDTWDGMDGEPAVYHGHTLTAKIKFVDVINAIYACAFETSQYPVIISIENHCSVNQQKLMAQHLKSILGDKIYTHNLGSGKKLPSPESLKGLFLIKGKKLDTPDSSEEVVSEEDEAADIDSDIVRKNLMRKPESKKLILAKELSDLIYLRSTHFKGVGQRGTSNCICSFAESKAIAMISEDKDEFANYNSTNLSRIYPNGIRTDSSNYDPLAMWKAGCQITALNFQTSGQKLQINEAFFRNNGGTGYIQKPGFLCYDSQIPFLPSQDRRKIFKIKIISAQQLPKPKRTQGEADVVDPYVRVKILGVDNKQEAKTRVIENNGFNPVWNETFEFMIDEPELTLIKFVVKDFDSSSKNDFIGQYTIPFNSILEGFHHAHLQDKASTPITPATLFLQCQILNIMDDLNITTPLSKAIEKKFSNTSSPPKGIPNLFSKADDKGVGILTLEGSPKKFHASNKSNGCPLAMNGISNNITQKKGHSIKRQDSFDILTPLSDTQTTAGHDLDHSNKKPEGIVTFEYGFGPCKEKLIPPPDKIKIGYIHHVELPHGDAPENSETTEQGLLETCLDSNTLSTYNPKIAIKTNGLEAKDSYNVDEDITPPDDRLCCNLFPSAISTTHSQNQVPPNPRPRERSKKAKQASSWKQDLCFEI